MNLSIKVIFCSVLPILFCITDVHSQNDGQSEDRRSQNQTFSFGMEDIEHIQYIDQLGMELLFRDTPKEDFLDFTSYKLNSRDVISVDVKGPVPLTARGLVISPQGTIFIPMAGNIYVKEMTVAEATEAIRSSLEKYLNEFELQISLDRARDITVHVYGDVPFPGKYVLPAGTRLDVALFPALFEGELPTNSLNNARYAGNFLASNEFSLRNIMISGKSETDDKRGDLMSYFRTGEKEHNPFLSDGDIIKVNRMTNSSPTITISGAVVNSGEFEYRNTDTIAKTIRLSGGFIPEADTSKAIIFRSQPEPGKIEIDLNSPEINRISLHPNDRIVIPHLDNKIRGASAWVQGEAVLPGSFPVNANETTLSELIALAGGLTDDALAESAYIIRSNRNVRDVRTSTDFNVQELKRTSDQIAQGFKYLELEENLNSERRLYVDLKDTLDLMQTKINDGDRLFIPRNAGAVVLYGQVNKPGDYRYDSTLGLNDYLDKAGGVTLAADTDRIFIIKAGSRTWMKPEMTDINSGDIIFVDRIPFDELNAQRSFDLQKQAARRNNIQLILSGLTAITGIITTVVAIRR